MITKGPWNTWRLAPDSDPEQRHIVTARHGDVEVCGIVGNDEDAILIAAAPDMLAALKHIRDNWEKNLTASMRRVNAAIARAEGRPAKR